jgi:DUF971 family protein|tara:strand:- start:35 stop:427 length:393 start_codon:yes stop_codon:yes gene_type:complete
MTEESFRPHQISIRKKTRQLELLYSNQESFLLSFEYLRINSPSAEVRGHNPKEEKLQYGKKNVGISKINRVGNYAIQIVFDDNHDSGIYSWEYLRYLSINKKSLWSKYLKKLSEEGLSRDPNEQVLNFKI